MKLLRVQLVAMVFIFSGCAWYQIQPIQPGQVAKWGAASGGLGDGYIIYQPELYFAVTTTPEVVKGTDGAQKTNQVVTVAPIYLPNYTKPYQVTTHNILGKADFQFAFENGWKLTSLSDKSDNSTIANTLAGTISTALSQAAKSAKGPGAAEQKTILYRPTFDNKGYIKGFVAVNYKVPDL